MNGKFFYLMPALMAVGCAQVDHRRNAIKKDALTATEVYRKREQASTSSTVLEWLQQGNRRFVAGDSTHGGYPTNASERVAASANGQRPLAVVLSCIDSRTSPELVFDTSVGDLFTARVGANVINDDILGSLEIAVESGAKVLVVLGHTDCGGIKGACSNLHLGHMTQLLDRVKPAIGETNDWLDKNPTASDEIGERVVSNKKYIAEISHVNAKRSVQQILDRSPLLRDKVKSKELIIISAIYNVETEEVKFDRPSISSK